MNELVKMTEPSEMTGLGIKRPEFKEPEEIA